MPILVFADAFAKVFCTRMQAPTKRRVEENRHSGVKEMHVLCIGAPFEVYGTKNTWHGSKNMYFLKLQSLRFERLNGLYSIKWDS